MCGSPPTDRNGGQTTVFTGQRITENRGLSPIFSKAMSKTSTKAATITIDGTQYALDNLTENARAQIVNLRVTDQEIARLQTQLAIAQTARAAYAQALTAQLPAAADAKQAK